MRDDPRVAEMVEIASSTDALSERAQGLLQTLGQWASSEAAWLALADPRSHVYATAASAGLDRSVVEFLDRPAVAKEIELTGLNRNQPPISVTDLPVPIEELPTWTECLTPAGFRGGLGVPLFDPGGLLGLAALQAPEGRGIPLDDLRDGVLDRFEQVVAGGQPVRA